MSRSLRLILLCLTLTTAVLLLANRSWRRHELQTRLASARLHLDAGDVQMALSTLQPLLKSDRQDGELFLVTARAFRMEKKYAAALKLLDKCVQLEYETEETDLERGLVLAELGHLAEAELALMNSPTKEAAWTLAKIHLQLLEVEKALHDLDNCRKLDPTNAEAWFLAGTVWAHVAEHEKAVLEFTKSLELNPDLYEARVQLALSLIELGRSAEASEHLRQCLAVQPADPLPALRLATCQIEQGDIATARAGLAKLVDDASFGTQAIVELAKLDLQDGDAEQADRLLSEAVRREPMNDAALYNWALALRRIGKTAEAATLMDRARTIQDARRQLADAMDRINSNPADNEARCDAAELLTQLADRDGAANLFTSVLARDPNHQRAQLGLSQLQ